MLKQANEDNSNFRTNFYEQAKTNELRKQYTKMTSAGLTIPNSNQPMHPIISKKTSKQKNEFEIKNMDIVKTCLCNKSPLRS